MPLSRKAKALLLFCAVGAIAFLLAGEHTAAQTVSLVLTLCCVAFILFVSTYWRPHATGEAQPKEDDE